MKYSNKPSVKTHQSTKFQKKKNIQIKLKLFDFLLALLLFGLDSVDDGLSLHFVTLFGFLKFLKQNFV